MTAPRIEFLADHPELANTLARWHWEEWGHTDPGGSAEGWARRLRGRLWRDRLPVQLIAFVDGVPVGTAAVVDHDMSTFPDRTPWLSGVFVLHPFRHRGIGRALVRAAMGEAQRLGFVVLWLYTDTATALYQDLGWEVTDGIDYGGRTVTIMRSRLVDATV